MVLRRLFVAAAVGWAGAIPAATWVSGLSQPSAAASLFALAVYGIGSAVCHQLTERSFFLWGRQLPVCARCTGIYVGAAFAALTAAAWRKDRPVQRRSVISRIPNPESRITRDGPVQRRSVISRIPNPESRITVFPNPESRITVASLAALPTALTLVYEWTTGVTPANGIRAAAGLVLGATIAWLVVYDVN